MPAFRQTTIKRKLIALIMLTSSVALRRPAGGFRIDDRE